MLNRMFRRGFVPYYDFALKIVKIYKQFIEEKHEYQLSKQLLRAGTSIAANIEESIGEACSIANKV